LDAAARVILNDRDGTISEQLSRHKAEPGVDGSITRTKSVGSGRSAILNALSSSVCEPGNAAPAGLLFDNGLGGFSPDGREFVICLRHGEPLPAPWANVLANPNFGSVVTEAGGGYTWAINSQLNRLTPWSNDPVSDPPSEIVYLRDEETGEFWTTTPAPCGG